MNRYIGYKEIEFSNDELTSFYENMENSFDLKENEYLLVKNQGKIIDKYRFVDGKLERIIFKTLGDSYSDIIKPRNPQQEIAFDMLKDERTTLKLITGGFGSGKTLALCTGALEAVNKGKFEKIIWVRNNIQVKDTDALGALPGEAIDKVFPYLGPFMDHTGGVDGISRLLREGKLEVIPLGFLRGRSLRNSIILCSEAENLTKEHIQLIIGRVDSGSELWLDADLKQRDKAVFEKSAGLETLIERLAGHKLFGYVHLVKTERSETAQLADLLD